MGAMTILSSINMFAMLPLQGLGQGAQPIVSYNYGAKDAKRVRGAFKLLLRSSLIYATALWLIIMLFPQAFTGLFTPNAELAAFTQAAMRRYFAVMFMFGIQVACQMTFTRHRQRKVLHSGCGGAKIRAAPAPYIPHALPVPGG